jgi:hypothetical protein
MIVSKGYSRRYDAALKSHSRNFLELNPYCRTEKRRSKTGGNRKPSDENKVIIRKDSVIKKTDNRCSKSTSTLSTCMRSTSKRPPNEYSHPNSTIQSKKTIESSKYSSRQHNRLISEVLNSHTTKKRPTKELKTLTQQSKQSNEESNE